MAKRAEVLELAILGLLRESPMHGYELRKRLNSVLGTFRALSYGSLYPALRSLCDAAWITSDAAVPGISALPSLSDDTPPMAGKRAKIVYTITAEGKEHLQQLLADAGPASWEDESFGVHLAFFRHTDSAVRLRILEGRRTRLEERGDKVRTTLSRTRERLDDYTLALQRHGLESVEREVRWLNELIDGERNTNGSTSSISASGASGSASPASVETSSSSTGASRPEKE